MVHIEEQEGPQERFLATEADIAIYGGAAFGGKSWALVAEPMRYLLAVPGFNAVIFRRTTQQIRRAGGMWAESIKLYYPTGARARESFLQWVFPETKNTITFAHLEFEKTKYEWDGAQVAMIGFDQLEHFSESQFVYMLSRNRSQCGVKPYIRATCNPDPDSFVARWCEWYIDQNSGYAIPERSGVIRYFVRRGDDLIWGDRPLDIVKKYPDIDPQTDIKSFTFIAAKAEDNKIGLAIDPGYIGNLRAMATVERERLLMGNWKIRPAAGMYFRREWFEVVDAAPAEARRARGWDLAATTAKEGRDPDYTASVRMARDPSGIIYIEHASHFRETPARVESAMRNLAEMDGIKTKIRIPQDPGQAGKSQAQSLIALLAGYDVRSRPMTGDKVTRASAFSAQVEAGNVKLVRGTWNDAFLTELENFPEGAHDDFVDACSEAFHELSAVRPLIGGDLAIG